jgi:hypothetical protein
MKLVWIAVLALVAPCALLAQNPDATGYPEHRVRQLKDSTKYYPEPYYPQNRLILRNVNLAAAGAGMQITGTVISDFEADRLPPGETTIEPGQQKVTVEIELVQFTTNLRRKGGAVVDPELAVNDQAHMTPVPGQVATVRVTGAWLTKFGELGMQEFQLPMMSKPLAPGVYALVARVHFRSQPASVQSALMWCSDWYGQYFWGSGADRIIGDNDKAEIDNSNPGNSKPPDGKLTREEAPANIKAGWDKYDENKDGFVSHSEIEAADPKTSEPIFQVVMDDPEKHKFFYGEVMNFIGKAESTCMIYIGNTLTSGRVELKAPGTRNPNYMLWTPHHVAAREIDGWKYENENAKTVVQQELDLLKTADLGKASAERKKAHEERIKAKEASFDSDVADIKKRTSDLIARHGGPTSKAEADMVRAALAAKPALLEQICVFEQELTYQYWILTTGYLTYYSHRVNHPGYQAWKAVSTDDMDAWEKERKEEADKLNDPAAKKQRIEAREEAWKLIPPEIRKVAFAYNDEKLFDANWDADKFCRKDGKDVILDASKWAAYRLKFIREFLNETAPIFEKITTTNAYANQVWPQALAQTELARNAVISLAYAYEYYIRTGKDGMKQDTSVVVDGWKLEAEQYPMLKLERYYLRAQGTPNSILNTMNGYITQVKDAVGVSEMERVYRESIKGN